MEHEPIDYAGLGHALLRQAESLMVRWLPNGIKRGGRWYIGDFDGSPGESANVNLSTGQWYDNAADDDKGGDLISLYARIHGLNNSQAARELMRDLGWTRDEDDHVQTPARAPAAQAVPSAPAESGDKRAVEKRKSMWRAVIPVPKHAPPATFEYGYRDKKNGDAWVNLEVVCSWAYEYEGHLYGHVARFERISSDGEVVKDTVPRTWCVDESDGRGGHKWRWKQWEQPRPLYVPATILSGDLSLPVVVVEGEKCAAAGNQLLGHEFDFVTWPGGCKAWSMASWSWLQGRKVFLWPDCDAKRVPLTKAQREANVDPFTLPLMPEHRQPGMKAMVGIGTLLQAKHACDVFICGIPSPGAVADGWDVADAIAEGWNAEKVHDFIRKAHEFKAPDDAARAAAGNPGASTAPAGGGSGGGDGEASDGGEDDLDGWRRYLLLSEKNAVKAVRENVVLALDGWPERKVPGAVETSALIAFNEFTNNVTKRRPTPWGTDAGDWDEADELLMGEWLVREKYLPSMSRGTLEEATLMVAKRHGYHPVRDEIESYRGTWDEEKRLSTWLRHAAMVEGEIDQPLQDYLARVGTWMVMAICARVLTPDRRNGELRVGPGCKFDYMPIFEGPQGWGKSTLAKVLGGDYFADTGLVLGEKDSYQNLQGILVYEWGELDSLNKSEVTKVKQFVSSQKDRFRASFDRRPRDYPRQVVFVGTTNEDHYLTDATGNRRFWPIRITKPVNVDWVRQIRQQLFAEALTYLDAGERFHPTSREQRELFDPQQQQRTVENAIQSSIYRYLHDEDQKVPHGGMNGSLVNEISLSELMTRIGYVLDKQTPQVMKQAGAAMKHLGWTVRRAAADSDNKRPRVYVRPAASKPQASASRDSSTGSPQSHATERAADACPF